MKKSDKERLVMVETKPFGMLATSRTAKGAIVLAVYDVMLSLVDRNYFHFWKLREFSGTTLAEAVEKVKKQLWGFDHLPANWEEMKNGWDGYPLMQIHFDADM